MEAFKLLNNQDHRAAREDVYNLYKQYESNSDLSIFEHKSVEIVRADFDEIGSLVNQEVCKRKEFWKHMAIMFRLLDVTRT